MTLGEQLEQRGQQKGRLEGKFEVAKNMLAKGVEVTFIEEVTELSFEEIAALIPKH